MRNNYDFPVGVMHLNGKELIGRSVSILQRYSQIFLDRELSHLNVGSTHFLFLIHINHMKCSPPCHKIFYQP